MTFDRRDFLQAASAATLGSLLAGGNRLLAQQPGDRPKRPEGVKVLNPCGRVPLSLIVDDSTCLVNLNKFAMPQFAQATGDTRVYNDAWRKWPAEIPDAFVRKFGDWASERGVKGKWSVVPYPACVGRLDRVLPGWTGKELTSSIDLVRAHLAANWDFHPEMVTHTWVIDTKTGQPYPERSQKFAENWQWSVGKSADELTDYLSYALRILKNVDIHCEGITTPGGFGNRSLEALSKATLAACRDVHGAEIPHYFRHLFDSGEQSVAPRVEYAADLETGDPKCAVSIIGCTGDWTGGWDCSDRGFVDRFITADLKQGRMVDVIERGEPACMVCHWTGIYFNGEEVGLKIFDEVVRRLGQRFKHTQWMKLSEIARYWAAKELTSIDAAGNSLKLQAPFATQNFTVQWSAANAGAPRLSYAEKGEMKAVRLEEVRSDQLRGGTFARDKDVLTACFALPKGRSQLEWQSMSEPTPHRLRDDAWKIWLAGLEAVRADKLVERTVRREESSLWIGDELLDLNAVGRIVVVGAGKAGAGMAAGLEAALGNELLQDKHVSGLVNVPADCLRSLSHIELNAARPAGINEPRPAGVRGTERMLDMIGELEGKDVCIALISGGGSALLPAPREGISLEDKIAVARVLSAAGANIAQLNAVRSQLSRVKGGGLARACRAGRLFTLIVSDVLGDPLDVIASGPTVENLATPADALAVLRSLRLDAEPSLRRVVHFLEERSAAAAHHPVARAAENPRCQVVNLVIGNNATAVDAAGMEAERLGYSHAMHAATSLEGEAEEIGRHLADMAIHMAAGKGPNCLITGGEPVVRLADASVRGIGGRNQQLALAALQHLRDASANSVGEKIRLPQQDGAPIGDNIVILSAGTDGEDGPTDAAGAVIDGDVWRHADERQLDIADFLRRNDAYRFFQQTGGLLQTGPTHTNVCDVRVVLARRADNS